MNTSQWEKVYRSLDEAQERLTSATTEEQFQAIGVVCREALISLAQIVFDPEKHQTKDGILPSETDAKRMLDAYLGDSLSGKSNETARRQAKATIDLANELQHKRTATYQNAALCIEATVSAVKLISVLAGYHHKMTSTNISVDFSYRGITLSQDEHLYLLEILVKNDGGRAIKEFKLEFTFPNLDTIPTRWHVIGYERQSDRKLIEVFPLENTVSVKETGYLIHVTYRSKESLFPKDSINLSEIIGLRYRIDQSIFSNFETTPPLKWILYAGDLSPKQGEISIEQLNKF